MIQFNLLPDVKLEYVKTQRTKRTVITAALMSAGSSFVIFLLLFVVVHVIQTKSMNDLNADIKTSNTKLRDTPDLTKILTIQSQLGALPKLHADKVEASRTFKYVQQITPVDVTLSELKTDFVANTMSLSGDAKSLDKVNTYIDTLKFTTYSEGETKDQKAFTDVVLSEFSKNPLSVTYTITATYAPSIFDNNVNPSLKVPEKKTTRSVVEQPTNLFQKPVVNTNESIR